MFSRHNIFVAEYKHIGKLVICIDGTTVRIYSALGIRSYSFPLLQPPMNNSHSILKLAIRLYFSSILPPPPTPLPTSSFSSFFSFFFNIRPSLPPSSDFHSQLSFLASSANYDLDDISKFYLYKSKYNIEVALSQCVPLYVLECDVHKLLQIIDEENIKNYKSVNKKSENLFYIKERKYIEETKEILEKVEDINQSKLIRSAVVAYEEFIGESLELQSMEEITVYLSKRIEILEPYEQLMKLCGEISACSGTSKPEMKELSIVIAKIIQKITNMPRLFSSLAPDTQKVRHSICKFLRFNRKLNEIAENSALRVERRGILENYTDMLEKNGIIAIFQDERLLASIKCKFNDKSSKIMLFENCLILLDSSYRLIARLDYSTTIHLFNRCVFIFGSPLSGTGTPFGVEPISGMKYCVVDCESREETQEFIDTFHIRKHNALANYSGLMIVPVLGTRQCSNNFNGLFLDVINEKGKQTRYSIRNTSKIIKEEIKASDLLDELKVAKTNVENELIKKQNMQIKLKVFNSKIREEDMIGYSLEIQPDEEISYKQKIKVSNEIVKSIIGNKKSENINENEENRDETKQRIKVYGGFELSDNSLLWRYTAEIIDWCVKTYLEILRRDKRVLKKIKEISAERLSLILIMFLERNYYFIFANREIENKMENEEKSNLERIEQAAAWMDERAGEFGTKIRACMRSKDK